MGTAMATHLAGRGHRVHLWMRHPDDVAAITATGASPHLPSVPLPDRVVATSDAADLLTAEALLVAIPSKFLRGQLRQLATVLRERSQPVISVVKGLEVDTFARPSAIIRDELGERPVACLSGPSHAEEIAVGLPASLVAASDEADWARRVQTLATGLRFRVYTNDDLTGTELAGGLKNIMGLAAGISDGIGYGDNAKAALLTRATAEMQRFGAAMGADAATFAGLAGIGDLITTCTSRHGRNRAVGQRLGQGERLEAILDDMGGSVAEGVPTTQAVHALARSRGWELPIVAEVHAVLFDGKSPTDACDSLMTRPLRAE